MRWLLLLCLTGCIVGDEADDDSVDATDNDFEAVGNPKLIDVGFNGAAGGWGVTQFAYFDDFFTPDAIQAGPRLCHTYVVWNVANEPAGIGSAASPEAHRAAFSYWLQHAQTDGHCTEVLVSFKAQDVITTNDVDTPRPGVTCLNGSTPPCGPPPESAVHAAFVKFVDTDWRAETGYTGSFAFTPWNEPNNQHAAGNGLGKVIPPEAAARFYLLMASACQFRGGVCKVAAGDFASNGQWPRDFEWNCANDNIRNLTTESGKCRHPSPMNPGNKLAASYLDRYKNYIALNAARYHVPPRPAYFAFHGWHDANEYIHDHSQCGTYANCVERRLLKSLGGSWANVELWDTEVGASQGEDLTNHDQACAAAFLVDLHAASGRIRRIYYTRLHNGGMNAGGELVGGDDPLTAVRRPAGDVLAHRERTFAPSCP